MYFQGYDYAGLQARAYCSCGNTYGSHGLASESECDETCTGDTSQICGGGWRNSVYKTGKIYGHLAVPVESG